MLQPNRTRNKFEQKPRLIQHAVYPITPEDPENSFFFLRGTLRENQFVGKEHEEGGVTEPGPSRGAESVVGQVSAVLLEGDASVCVQIKWRDRKMHY